jgi:hydroxymethylpyrimidine pyrophosphatase-like HAD family hydrolase
MDIGMLGYYQGIAVANAFLEVRQAACYHTLSNDEDGVAHWLKMQFLS